jgi:DNA-binding transcriptional LysR family regulator
MLREARAVLAAADQAAEVAAELVSGRSGVLRIGIAPGLRDRLGRGLSVLRTRTPDLEVRVSPGSTADCLAALRNGELDVAFVRGEVAAADLQAVELWREPLSVLLPVSFRNDDGVKLIDLTGLPLRLPSDPWLLDTVTAACRAAGFEPVIGRPADDLEAAIVEIASGSPAWTVVYGTACETAEGGVWMGPFEPGLSAPGHLVVADGRCLDELVTAFG